VVLVASLGQVVRSEEGQLLVQQPGTTVGPTPPALVRVIHQSRQYQSYVPGPGGHAISLRRARRWIITGWASWYEIWIGSQSTSATVTAMWAACIESHEHGNGQYRRHIYLVEVGL
jgi:hypothetical protein